MVVIKKAKLTNASNDTKKEICALFGNIENSLEFPQKLKIHLYYRFSYSISGYIFEGNEISI